MTMISFVVWMWNSHDDDDDDDLVIDTDTTTMAIIIIMCFFHLPQPNDPSSMFIQLKKRIFFTLNLKPGVFMASITSNKNCFLSSGIAPISVLLFLSFLILGNLKGVR